MKTKGRNDRASEPSYLLLKSAEINAMRGTLHLFVLGESKMEKIKGEKIGSPRLVLCVRKVASKTLLSAPLFRTRQSGERRQKGRKDRARTPSYFDTP